MIHLLVGKFQRSVVFTAGPFTDLKISTFIAVTIHLNLVSFNEIEISGLKHRVRNFAVNVSN